MELTRQNLFYILCGYDAIYLLLWLINLFRYNLLNTIFYHPLTLSFVVVSTIPILNKAKFMNKKAGSKEGHHLLIMIVIMFGTTILNYVYVFFSKDLTIAETNGRKVLYMFWNLAVYGIMLLWWRLHYQTKPIERWWIAALIYLLVPLVQFILLVRGISSSNSNVISFGQKLDDGTVAGQIYAIIVSIVFILIGLYQFLANLEISIFTNYIYYVFTVYSTFFLSKIIYDFIHLVKIPSNNAESSGFSW
jgi:hypothetical protein